MRAAITLSAALLLLASSAGAQGGKPLTKCPPDAVVSGTVRMDTYEASVWRVPNPLGANKALIKKIQQGKVKLADLTARGAMQLGTASDDYAPCADSGQVAPTTSTPPAPRVDAGSLRHLVPGAAGLQERAQAPAVECRVAGGRGGDPSPGAG